MFFTKSLLLNIIITLPLLGIFLLLLTSFPYFNFFYYTNHKEIKIIAFNITSFTFLISLIIWILFKKDTSNFQFVTKFFWVFSLNLNCNFGIDGISLFFLILTTLLFPLCILSSWNKKINNLKYYLITFLLLEFFLIGAFLSMELLMFYVFFESVLIPMFLIIGIWGSRERKIKASYYFFLYTLTGSLLMLLSIIYIYSHIGSTYYEILLTFTFSEIEQKVIWFSFFISFSAKIPSIPLHLWLPEAHVEAPTEGSVILAGVLLKLGTYGFIRFSIPILSKISLYFTPLVYSIALISIIYTSFTAIRQTDLKRIIAYTSIAHMNLVVLSIFSFNIIGIEGSIIQSLSHGFVASAFFLLIGIFYDRYQTKIVKYYSGLVHTMPLCTFFFFFFTLANMALPGTSNFIGELLIFTGIFKSNNNLGFFGVTSIILSSCYSLWLYNRISYGNLKTLYNKINLDLNTKELAILLPLVCNILVLGLTPTIFLDSIHCSANKLIELTYF